MHTYICECAHICIYIQMYIHMLRTSSPKNRLVAYCRDEGFRTALADSGARHLKDNNSLLGRALGHFTFSLIGLKRILFTNMFQKL